MGTMPIFLRLVNLFWCMFARAAHRPFQNKILWMSSKPRLIVHINGKYKNLIEILYRSKGAPEKLAHPLLFLSADRTQNLNHTTCNGKDECSMKNVKVILWGLGAMGGGIGKMLCKKQGVDIVGAIDIGAKLSKSLYDVVPGIERGDREDVIVGTAEEVIRPGAADIVVVCTNSFTRDVYDKLVFVMERGMNVITSAEEMAYPQAQEPELAAKLDAYIKTLAEQKDSLDEATLEQARQIHRHAQFYWDYVMVENSEGAHNYKAAHANLDKAEAQLEEGFKLLGIA